MDNGIMFEIKNLLILILVIIIGLCSGIIRVGATNTLRVTYQASEEYDQRNEQEFRDKISRRIQELEGR